MGGLAPGSKELLFVQENCLVVTEIHFKPFMKFCMISQEMSLGVREEWETQIWPFYSRWKGRKLIQGNLSCIHFTQRTSTCVRSCFFVRPFHLHPHLLPSFTGVTLTKKTDGVNHNMNMVVCVLLIIPMCVWLVEVVNTGGPSTYLNAGHEVIVKWYLVKF